MRIIMTTFILLSASIFLANCHASDDLTEPPTAASSSSAAAVSSSTPTTSPADTQSPAPAASPHPAATPAEQEPAGEIAPPAAAEPTFVQCWENNAALLSDGSIVTDTERCHDEAFEQLEQLPSDCVGPAAVCGYGYDEQGRRNPSSGEIQAYHGCQAGYIDDADLCAVVTEIIER